MNDFIEVYDNALPLDVCNQVIDVVEHYISVGLAHDSRQSPRRGQRKDFQVFLNSARPDVANAVFPYLGNVFEEYTKKYPSLDFISLNAHELKVQKIPEQGGFHNWHCEQGFEHQQAQRFLTFMIYLNDTAEGDGTTEFIEYGKKIQPKAGRIVLFPAGFTHTHRGNPVYKSCKYIITGWFLRLS